MAVQQGDILWIDLNPAKGSEIKKKRPCVVISNQHYNHFFNTAIVLPISSSEKYRQEPKYVESPFFETIDLNNVHGTILLQHLRTINIKARSNGEVVDVLPKNQVQSLTERIKQFF
ncbi:type II toxin-antitoxin system PemK/MazF family toxin [Limosilactobacillus reuteri]|uniref:type II toxin-antitoxin system PemK/MazF family toxin n=1 Tax=Limosilactobacillus reuteri TaxID=1598 RepID=UPI001E47F030|nr:type II toxin-antitoxin system PemK/MazF family toxin [Limosilactobacillus reuteri]MCC4370545.1 type II toxin-antitoxin system PemK/MazF family toxin [Limosilactobacillus reuteri]MCC4371886.1 type II toxin-antitoxin system PemK/MazF family toxin [Limosilactobacillus reuteri]MCC4509400.1 type II toxin-antitoxin system PemK/MazF family toxin [Limosilactobacillus reuteri]